MDTWRDHADKSCWVNASVDFEPGKSRGEAMHSLSFLKPKKTESLLWNRLAVPSISYQETNKQMLKCPHGKNQFRTVFVDFDDSPRRRERAIIAKGSTPKRFGKYLKKSMELSRQEGNAYVFINAWNEWGEGNYLEPDTRHGYAYLKQVKKVYQKDKLNRKKHSLRGDMKKR